MRPYLLKHPDLFGTPEAEVIESKETIFIEKFLPSLMVDLSIK